ncbi:MAG TPA: hypothetical protein VFS10_18560 [Pyrinomonadaceae bacterium]|nr:hypothetical protein [Pyrinomonadaceae bacterium]
MTPKSLTGTFKEKLRDPIWQAVGALIALVSLFLPFLFGASMNSSSNPAGSAESGKVMIFPTTSVSLINFPEALTERTRLLIDGKEEQDVRLYIFYVEYRGNRPLRKDDFEAPIRGSLPQDRKIITVQKSPDAKKSLWRDESGHESNEERAPAIDFEITLNNQQNFEIKPMLMNPGEWFKLEVYTSARTSDAKATKTPTPVPTSTPDGKGTIQNKPSEITWVCRIAGVRCPAPYEPRANRSRLLQEPWFLQVYLEHQGWAIYFIVLFVVVNLMLILILAKIAGIVQPLSFTEMLFISVIVVSSLSVSEVLADWLFKDNALDKQPLVSTVLLFIHAILFIILLVYIIATRKKAASRNP